MLQLARFNRVGVFAFGILLALCLGEGCPTATSSSNTGSAANSNASTGASSNNGYLRNKQVLPSALKPNVDEFSEDNSDASSTQPGDDDNVDQGDDQDGEGEHGHHRHGDGHNRHGPDHRCCALGHTGVIESHHLLDRGLAIIDTINSDIQASGGTDPHLTGTLPVHQTTVAYKADFSAFDIDGDGTPDGSGSPTTAPVAVRIWVDPNGDGTYTRYAAALITTLPTPPDTTNNTPGNAGAGKLYVQPGVLVDEANTDVFIFVTWDHSNPANTFNDVFFKGSLRPNLVVADAHARVDVVTLADSSVQKTLKITAEFTGNDFAVSEFEYATRTVTGLGFALFNASVTGSGVNGSLSGCLSLTTCTFSATGCESIDATGLDYLPAPTGTEAAWPADFPETPTF